jgi:hypothetical protein
MYKSKVRVIPLSEEDEIIVMRGFARPGVLTDVSVHYRALIRGKWVEVARWDNAHGRPHAHFFWRKRPPERLPSEITPTRLLKVALDDLLCNAFEYREKMELA